MRQRELQKYDESGDRRRERATTKATTTATTRATTTATIRASDDEATRTIGTIGTTATGDDEARRRSALREAQSMRPTGIHQRRFVETNSTSREMQDVIGTIGIDL